MNINLWLNYKSGSGSVGGLLLICWPSSKATANDIGTLIRGTFLLCSFPFWMDKSSMSIDFCFNLYVCVENCELNCVFCFYWRYGLSGGWAINCCSTCSVLDSEQKINCSIVVPSLAVYVCDIKCSNVTTINEKYLLFGYVFFLIIVIKIN